MKSTELRVGNLVSVDGKILPVTQIFEKGLNCGNVGVLYELVKPIPLTEEWLEGFGFEYSDLNGDSGLWKIPPFQIYGKYNQFIYDYRLDVNYVHQLQNLYFALTGEELNQNKEDANSTDNFNNNGIPSV
jgi:hypothetical protein